MKIESYINDKYKIKRYFDDHYDGTVGEGLTKEEAIKLVEKYEKLNKPYTSYSILKE